MVVGKSIGKGIAICGVWIGWAIAMKAIMLPILQMLGAGSTVLTVVALVMLGVLYISAFALVYSATAAILHRWDRQGKDDGE